MYIIFYSAAVGRVGSSAGGAYTTSYTSGAQPGGVYYKTGAPLAYTTTEGISNFIKLLINQSQQQSKKSEKLRPSINQWQSPKFKELIIIKLQLETQLEMRLWWQQLIMPQITNNQEITSSQATIISQGTIITKQFSNTTDPNTVDNTTTRESTIAEKQL